MNAPVQYDQINAVNWSSLKHMATSARLYRCRLMQPRKDTAALRLGRAIHCAILEPERWSRDYARQPHFGDLRTKIGKAARDEWMAEIGPDVEPLAADEYDLAMRCAQSVSAHPVASQWLRGGRVEEPVTWTDEETSLPCKARLDFIAPRSILDLKSTRRETIREFEADFARLMYHGQIAHYHRGAIASGRIPVDAEMPRVIAVQTVEPYDVIAMRISPDDLAKGTALVRALLHRVADCQAADLWPGLAPSPIDSDLPAWAPGGEEPPEEDW